MDRSAELKLIAKTYAADAIGQLTPTETSRTVFCNVRSVTQGEFFAGAEIGIRPEYRATMFAPDYEGEETAEYNGKRYEIYRTYLGDNESIELYLATRVGVQ
ncbi:phage head-tail adapter protein [Candidatus Saccharibacteria bacterium]|nr:phage head-tail adapter protein [Candidatus Saccharibacteria bacterium]MBR4614579.1 phage head-tail adapter protein [Kiritimatiellia bacterium]